MDPRDDEQIVDRADEPNSDLDDETSSDLANEPRIVILMEEPLDTHEPPIGTGGDPVYVDPPKEVDMGDGSALQLEEIEGLATRYFRYAFTRDPAEPPYRNLHHVKVLTEEATDEGAFTLVEYKIPRSRISRLELWLEDTNGDPDIIVAGENGGYILTVQRFELRTMAHPAKSCRQKRYHFPNRDVRIIRWRIVDADGFVLNDPTRNPGDFESQDDDQYYFYIYFDHA